MPTDEAIWPAELFSDLDRTGPVPLYFQVSSRLEQAIRTGALPPGSRLENEIAIGQHLGLSRPTIRRAIQELVDKGLLVRRRGIGTQVVQGQVARQVELTSLFEDLQISGMAPATDVLDHRVVTATSTIAEQLGVSTGSEVVLVRRRRTTEGVPVAVLENYLPIEFRDLTTEQLAEKGLYQLLRARGVTIQIAKQRIGARRAQADEGALLEIAEDDPVLTMDRVAFDNAGRVIEYGRHCYRTDSYHFETTLVAK